MKLKVLIGILAFVLLSSIAYADITISPSSIDIVYTIGDDQPSNVTIVFNNTATSNVTLSLSKNDPNNLFSISDTSLAIENQSSANITVSFSISQSISTGLYRSNITYNSSIIPVYITVQSSSTTQCKLSPLVTSYITSIKSDASPYSQKFTVRIGSDCYGGVDISDVILMGVTQTAEGSKPIRLTGSLSLGNKNPGEEASFYVEFDVSGMSTGTYTPYAKVVGTYNDNPISTEIDFKITVTSTISPYTGEFTEPTYLIPTQVSAKQEFEVKAINVDPNLDIYLFPNQNLVGKSVSTADSTWTWKGYIDKTGTYTLQLSTLYQGGQIGSVYNHTIKVVGYSYSGSGNLTFDFYPEISELQDDDMLSILCRDSLSNDIVSCTLYLNGVESDKSIKVNTGKQYCLSATSPTYSTLDECFTLEKKNINIYITPSSPEVGDTITVTTKDPTTNNNINATIYLDGITSSKTFIIQTSGNHTIKAVLDGYNTTTKKFSVLEAVSITYQPSSIEIGQNATITLSKNSSYYVVYQANANAEKETLLSGDGDTITFVPDSGGIYEVYVRNVRMAAYEIPTLEIPSGVWIALSIILIVIILIFLIKKGKLSIGKGIETSAGEFELSPKG